MRGISLGQIQERLGRELQRHNGQIRPLAREIAERADVNPETARRAIYRIVSESTPPKPEVSEWLERGLGRSPGYLTVKQVVSGHPRDRLAVLEGEVVSLRSALAVAKTATTDLLQRVEALERRESRRRVPATQRGPRQK